MCFETINPRTLKTPLWLQALGFHFLVIAAVACRQQAQEVQAQVSPSIQTRIHLPDSTQLVLVPSGEFIMGSDSVELAKIWVKMNWNPEELAFTQTEQPAHRVRLDGFWMYRTLVTVKQYRSFAQAKNLPFPDPPSYGWAEKNPVVNITWDEASYYCRCQGGRLPTEAEWEYAARAGNTGLDGNVRSIFVWGNDNPTSPVGNLADKTFLDFRYYDHDNFHGFEDYTDRFATASDVTAFLPNSFGLYDMAGNVLEWCSDWYSERYLSDSIQLNPKGPNSGTRKVLRGGAFDTTPTITRISRRLGNFPNIRNEEKGFRCVVDF